MTVHSRSWALHTAGIQLRAVSKTTRARNQDGRICCAARTAAGGLTRGRLLCRRFLWSRRRIFKSMFFGDPEILSAAWSRWIGNCKLSKINYGAPGKRSRRIGGCSRLQRRSLSSLQEGHDSPVGRLAFWTWGRGGAIVTLLAGFISCLHSHSRRFKKGALAVLRLSCTYYTWSWSSSEQLVGHSDREGSCRLRASSGSRTLLSWSVRIPWTKIHCHLKSS